MFEASRVTICKKILPRPLLQLLALVNRPHREASPKKLWEFIPTKQSHEAMETCQGQLP